MKNFNITRFGHLLKLDLNQYGKTYLSFTGGCLIAHFIVQFLVFKIANVAAGPVVRGSEIEALVISSFTAFCITSSLLLLIGASLLWNNLKTKELRIAYFMIPATNTEKYLSRLLLCTVGVFVLNLLAFFVADLLRLLFFITADLNINQGYAAYFSFIVNNSAQFMQGVNMFIDEAGYAWLFSMAISALSYPAWFLFGSAIFRTYAFVKTWLLIMCISTVTFALFNGSIMLMTITTTDSMKDLNTIIWAQNALNFTLSVVFIWLSYYLFKRMTVIPRKLF